MIKTNNEKTGRLFAMQNIRMIEILKTHLLSNLAELYKKIDEGAPGYDINGAMADIIIMTYILAQRLGSNAEAVDMNAVKKLRLAALEENNDLYEEIVTLKRYLLERSN